MSDSRGRLRQRALLAGPALWLLAGLAPAQAQDTPASAPAAEESETITVTATRRRVAIQDTGAAITALTGAELEERGAAKVEDLQYQVPGLVYGETSGSSQVGIRGVGLSVETGFAEQGVASYIDGVFLPRPGMTNLNIGDISQVEVLRGPQGTLYGRNATGGIINFITNKPTSRFEAGFKAGYSEFETYRGEAFVSGPITEQFLARLFVSGSDTDGYIDNPLGFKVGDEEQLAGRAAFRLVANPDLTLDLSVMSVHQEGGYVYNQATNAFGPLYAIPPATSRPRVVTSEVDPDAEHDIDGGIFTVSFNLGENTEGKAITSYLKETRSEFSDSDGVPDAITWLDRRESSKSISQEFNFNGTAFGDALDWVAGVYYFNEEANLNTDVIFFAGFGGTLVQGLNERNNTYGVFTDLTVNVTDDFRLVGGLRYGRDEKDISFEYVNPLVPVSCTGSAQVNLDSLNPKAGAEFDVTDDVMVYAQYSRGTKPGGGNISGATCDDLFGDEKIDAYEGGIKSSFSEGRLTLNSSVFYYDYTDYQVFQIIFPSASIVNAPKSSVLGVELELFANPTDSLSINAGLTYLDAQYDEFTDSDSFGVICAIPGQCPTIPYVPTALPQDLSGNKLARSPEWTFNLGAENRFDLGGDGLFGALTVRGEAYYTDEMYFRQFNEAWDRQDSYWLFNAFVTLESADEMWALRAYAKNIGDEDYVVSQFSNASPLGNSATLGIFGAPRTVGIELVGRFGGE